MIDPTTAHTPPHDADAEAALIGAALAHPEVTPRVLGALTDEAFFLPDNRLIFRAMRAVAQRGDKVDLLTTHAELRRMGADLPGHATTDRSARAHGALYTEQYVRRISDLAVLRGQIRAARAVLSAAFTEGADPMAVAADARKGLADALELAPQTAARPFQEGLAAALEMAREAESTREQGGTIAIPTGLAAADAIYNGGLRRKKFYISAGRPSMGKSIRGLGAALAAARAGYGALVFALEMDAAELAQRALSAEADVQATAVQTGRLLPEQWDRLGDAQAALGALPVWVNYAPGLTPEQFEADVAAAKARMGDALGLVVVDYLQLMAGGSRRASNREQEVSHISRTMKLVAGRYDVAVLALCQLSRAVETRGGDKRPMLSDLRESGTLEQDADAVEFVYRAERYGIADTDAYIGGQYVSLQTDGLAEIIVGKQRGGKTGTAYVGFDPDHVRFYDKSFAVESYPAGGDSAPRYPEPSF